MSDQALEPLDGPHGTTKSFHKGQIIYKEGQTSSVAYMLKSGKVQLVRLINNKRVIMGTLGPGQIFGHMGVISGGLRTTNAEAVEFCECLIIDKQALKTQLLKSPRPVQIITGYLIDRVRALSEKITDRPFGNLFTSVCQLLAMQQRLAGKAGGSTTSVKTVQPNAEMSYAEVAKTVKDILLISQLELDDVVERLSMVGILESSVVKQSYSSKDPLLGTVKKGNEYIVDRMIRIPDVDKFLTVTRNLAKEAQGKSFGAYTCDLEFIDLGEYAKMVDSTVDILYKKVGFGEFPQNIIFLHKPQAQTFAERMGTEFFKQAKRPRLKADELESVDDIVSVDNDTLQDVFSRLGFHKLSILAAVAREEARARIYSNLSTKMAAIVRDEAAAKADIDPADAAAAEDELLDLIKASKGAAK